MVIWVERSERGVVVLEKDDVRMRRKWVICETTMLSGGKNLTHLLFWLDMGTGE